ncbi:MAG: DUF58 domain-containing protein [Candidatus Obscuribacterales bacterium]|nr:DUF58 domain-containing protein [Candidatus Obscuribacterales bacterium]
MKQQAATAQTDTQAKTPPKPAGLKLPFGAYTLLLEPRVAVILAMVPPLYITAAFIGNDWCYIVPCLLIATLIVGIVLPFIEVSSIACDFHVPQRAGNLEQQEIVLRAWRLPLFGLLSELVPSGYLSAELILMRRTWNDKKRERSSLPLPLVLQSLSKGVEIHLGTPALGRGVYQVDSLEVATCFPFAIAWWSRRIDLKAKNDSDIITVLPKLVPVLGNFHSRLTTTITRAGNSIQNWKRQNKSSSLKGLREFTERDSLNQIHWASSAKSGKLLVREFEIESLPDFDVMLDLSLDWNDEQFNTACMAAYSMVHYGHQMGFSPQLRFSPSMDWEPLAAALADVPPGLSSEELAAEMLARVNPLTKSLLKCYEDDMQAKTRKADDLLSEVAASSHTTLSLVPATDPRSKVSKIISLVELQPSNARAQGKIEGKSNQKNGNDGPSIAQLLGQLSNDVELSRL